MESQGDQCHIWLGTVHVSQALSRQKLSPVPSVNCRIHNTIGFLIDSSPHDKLRAGYYASSTWKQMIQECQLQELVSLERFSGIRRLPIYYLYGAVA